MTDLESTSIDGGDGEGGEGGEGGKCRVSTFTATRAPRPRYGYLRPGSLPELWELLERFPSARLVAGGTDVMPAVRQGALRPPVLISLRGITELAGIALQARGGAADGDEAAGAPAAAAAAAAAGAACSRCAGSLSTPR